MALNDVADISQVYTWFYLLYPLQQALPGDLYQALGANGGGADSKHFTGISVISIFDNGYIQVDDISVFEFFITGDAVANDMIYRGTDRFWKTVIVEWGRNRLLGTDDIVVADAVQFVRGYTGSDVRFNHLKYFSSKPSDNAHFFNLFDVFDGDAHGAIFIVAVSKAA